MLSSQLLPCTWCSAQALLVGLRAPLWGEGRGGLHGCGVYETSLAGAILWLWS